MAFKVSDFVFVFKGYKVFVNGERVMPRFAKKDNRLAKMAVPALATKCLYITLA